MNRKLLFYLGLLYLIFLGMTWKGNTMLRQLIYYPQKEIESEIATLLMNLNFQPYPHANEVKGYLRHDPQPEALIVFFHGNAGHAAHRTYMVQGFLAKPYALYLAEYPGYGERAGKPTEDYLQAAAIADIEQLKKQYGSIPLYLVGESLGTGVISLIANEVNPAKIVLISPFTSLVEVGKHHYPILPVNSIIPDRYESITNLTNLTIPLLLIHGNQDNVVPYVLGEKLYKHYTGPKNMLTLAGYGHNDLPWHRLQSEFWQKIQRFIEE